MEIDLSAEDVGLYRLFNRLGLDRFAYSGRIKHLQSRRISNGIPLSRPEDEAVLNGHKTYLHGYTGFMRGRAPIEAMMESFRQTASMPQDRPWRLLDAPSSTGNEPYSISALAIQKEMNGDLGFEIDAFDASEKFTRWARERIYPWSSLDGLSESDRALLTNDRKGGAGTTFRISDAVANNVNILDAQTFQSFVAQKTYDAVYCTNMFMYLNREAKQQTVRAMEQTGCQLVVFNYGNVSNPRRMSTPEQSRALYRMVMNNIINDFRAHNFVPASEHPKWADTPVGKLDLNANSYTAVARL